VTGAVSRPASRVTDAAGAREGWRARLSALLAGIALLAAAWSLVSIALRHRQWRWPGGVDIAFGVLNVPAEPSLFTAAVMLLLAGALRRRLRAALLLALLFEALIGVFQLYLLAQRSATWDGFPGSGVDIERGRLLYLGVAGVLGILAAALMWRWRDQFPARLRPGSLWAAILTLAAGVAVSSVITIALAEAFPHSLRTHGERALWGFRMAVGAVTDVDALQLHGRTGPRWVAVLAGLMSALALLAAVRVFVRSARAKETLDAEDELAVRRLLIEDGERDSLGYFATRRDKAIVWSPDGRAAVSYRVLASVSLVSADPIGPVAAWASAIEAWLTEARAHGWIPAVLAASQAGARAYAAAGLKVLSLGDEAVVQVEDFSLRGPTMRPVRQAVTRIQRGSYQLQVRRHGDIPARELASLASLAEQWRGNGTERGFSMALNRLGDATDERCVMVTAHDSAGAVHGLLSFVPWGARGLSLDLMRRDAHAGNGLVEFMVAGLIEHCPDLGVSRVSLNFAMFRSVFSAIEEVGAGPVMRLTGAVLTVASRFWQIETLYRSNAKYLPHWTPRFMCYESSASLARISIASGMAEGFLPAPHSPATSTSQSPVLAPDGTTVSLSVAVREQYDRLAHPVPQVRRPNAQQSARRQKIGQLEAAGFEAYPVSVPRTHDIADVQARHRDLPAGQRTGERVSITGRVHALRDFGGVIFAVLREGDEHCQAMLSADHTPEAARLLWRRTVDLGDHVSVSGEVVTSARGELSVLVDDWSMAAKCLRPLPDAHSGLIDPQARVRQRYLDLMVNHDSMATLRARSTAISALRAALAARGFTEVETPMLQSTHGGATARPFRTHINAYDADLYLRIAPELHLKQLCVAGMGRIFELNRNFRNEGADATHNPEFTSLEAYQAYADYNVMRDLTRDLIIDIACRVHGAPVAMRPAPDGSFSAVALNRPWPQITVHEAVSMACRTEVTPGTSRSTLRELGAQQGIHTRADASAGELTVALYESLVEKQTGFPTFYTDFPLDTSPLTRRHRTDPRLAERWDLVAFGTEIGTAYSELVDPIDQRERLTRQSLRAAAGDPEAMQLDEEFLTALEYAMPPTGGLGIGVDRLVMMLTGTNIRSSLAFPFVKPTDG
jgi:lysyl-tRNA synthetase class 2